MTTHELEQFIERAWNDPAYPPARIPAEVIGYALERGRRARTCELKRMLATIRAWLRPSRTAAKKTAGAGSWRDVSANPC